jgi:hypothetical protein
MQDAADAGGVQAGSGLRPVVRETGEGAAHSRVAGRVGDGRNAPRETRDRVGDRSEHARTPTHDS